MIFNPLETPIMDQPGQSVPEDRPVVPAAAQSGPDRQAAFTRHPEQASAVVSTWPAWKQRLLGGAVKRPATRPDRGWPSIPADR